MARKERVRDLLERLPDDCSIDDVLYHRYAVLAIEHGLADAEAGCTIPHEQVAEEVRKRRLFGDCLANVQGGRGCSGGPRDRTESVAARVD